ncbi:MAG: TonB-dependent receptor [Pseudomonadota bacterium]
MDFGPASEGDTLTETFTSEFRAAFNYERVSGWIGAYYFQTDDANETTFVTPISILGLPVTEPDTILSLVTSTETKVENIAVFGDITFDISDQWTLSFGARYDLEEFDDNGRESTVSADPAGCAIAPGIPGIGGLPCVAILPVQPQPPNSADFEAFLPRGTAIYRFDDLMSLSFTVARGYRSGGSYLFAEFGGVPETREYDPEFLTNYEFAFRSEFPEKDLTLNANLFYTDWEDQQVSIPGEFGFFDTEILNSGTSELYGLEVEVKKTFSSELSGFMSLGILNTEFTDFAFAPGSGTQFENLAGRNFNNAPELNISAGLTYESADGFFLSGNFAYSDDQFSDVTNLQQNVNEDYILVNVRGGWRWDNYEVAIFADNLFDERFSNRRGLFNVDIATGTVQANQPAGFFTVNDPRLVGLEFRAGF